MALPDSQISQWQSSRKYSKVQCSSSTHRTRIRRTHRNLRHPPYPVTPFEQQSGPQSSFSQQHPSRPSALSRESLYVYSSEQSSTPPGWYARSFEMIPYLSLWRGCDKKVSKNQWPFNSIGKINVITMFPT